MVRFLQPHALNFLLFVRQVGILRSCTFVGFILTLVVLFDVLGVALVSLLGLLLSLLARVCFVIFFLPYGMKASKLLYLSICDS